MTSLEKFYTIAFDLNFMRDLIRANQCTEYVDGQVETFPMIGNVDAVAWFAIVPECYQLAVAKLVARISRSFVGRPLTPVRLDALVYALFAAIWNEIDSIHPSDINQSKQESY